MKARAETSPEPASLEGVRPEKGDSTMFCTHCGTRNGTDANFCKQCGHKLDRLHTPTISEEEFADLGQPDHRVSDLLALAFRKEADGDIDGAVGACSDALGVSPDSTSAHSLMGMLYEKAIEEFEQVLKLNPGSIADREKLEQLRDATTVITPRKITSVRRLPGPVLVEGTAGAVAASVAVFLLVLLIGGWVVWARGNQTAMGKSDTTTAALSNTNMGSPGPAQMAQNNPSAIQGNSVIVQRPNTVAPNANQLPNWQMQSAAKPRPQGEPNNELQPAPILLPRQPALESAARPQRTQPSGESSSTVHLPESSPEQGNTGQTPANPATNVATRPPQKNYGKVEIIVTDDNGRSKSVSSGSTVGSPNSSMESRSRRASGQQAQLRGDYRTAIREYIKALDGAGDDAAIIYQQIGLCYQRLGENDSAITNYNNAIAEYRRLVAAGRNADTANRGIKICETAIRACQ
jgi:tetratricopeptide (TPR) repeat protein